MEKICPDCGWENSQESRICEKCGCPLSENIICPDCATENPETNKICSNCGCPLNNPSDKKLKIVINPRVIATAVTVIVVIFGTVFGIFSAREKAKDEFREKLISGSRWEDSETDAEITFRDDGKVGVLRLDVGGGIMDLKLDSSLKISEYEVISGDTIKIGKEKVKVTIENNGEITFEPSIDPVIEKAIKEAEEKEKE